jgi:di/tricarboxylate transporter
LITVPHTGLWEAIVRELTSGRGQFRLLLLLAVALILGIRAGIADAREGTLPFARRLREAHEPRAELLKDLVKRALNPLALAFILDVILQRLTLGYVRPLTAIIVGAVLAWLPFVIVRGVMNRFWRRSHFGRRRAAHVH